MNHFAPHRLVRLCPLALAVFLTVSLIVLIPQAARAQATASVSGTVRDSSGAIIPDASVILHNRDTNLDRPTSSNEFGIYSFPSVEPGNYDIRVSKQGFNSAVQSNLQVVVNQPVTMDFAMKTGSVSTTVTVAANAVTLETASSELGAAIVKRQVNDLPLQGRNFTQLLNLTPGVSSINVSQNATTAGGIWSNPVGSFSYPAINGQTNRSNLFLLDGVNDQGSFGSTYDVAPIIDDVQEFKVQSHNDDASYGGVMGGVINVVTKSGTSSFHGSAWEFYRDSGFGGASDPAANNSLIPLLQHQFGATVGGPLGIPGHAGISKTFFFVGYEGYRQKSASGATYNSPTTTAVERRLERRCSPD